MPTKTYNVKELSGMLRVSEHTIYDWCRRNRIPYLRAGRGHFRFDLTDVGRALRHGAPPARGAA